jgi:hypothetical protein
MERACCGGSRWLTAWKDWDQGRGWWKVAVGRARAVASWSERGGGNARFGGEATEASALPVVAAVTGAWGVNRVKNHSQPRARTELQLGRRHMPHGDGRAEAPSSTSEWPAPTGTWDPLRAVAVMADNVQRRHLLLPVRAAMVTVRRSTPCPPNRCSRHSNRRRGRHVRA